MAGNAAETVIGAMVLAAAGGFLIYAANTADIDTVGAGNYELTAQFRKAEGLNAGSDVRIAGVKVGSIRLMELDPATYKAVVHLNMRGGIEVPEDTTARITAASLLGDSFIALSPGASEYMLEPGDEIQFTQSSVNLMDMAGRLIHGGEDAAPAE